MRLEGQKKSGDPASRRPRFPARSYASQQWEEMNKILKFPGTAEEFETGLRVLAAPTYYPMMCAWCRADGVETRVGWTTVEHSDGICRRHKEEMREQCGLQRENRGEAAADIDSAFP